MRLRTVHDSPTIAKPLIGGAGGGPWCAVLPEPTVRFLSHTACLHGNRDALSTEQDWEEGKGRRSKHAEAHRGSGVWRSREGRSEANRVLASLSEKSRVSLPAHSLATAFDGTH